MRTFKFSFFLSFFLSRLTYKKSFLIILLLSNTINFLYCQCPNGYIQVGSAVGVPNLSSSNLISYNPGPKVNSPKICVSGDFLLDVSASFLNVEMIISSGSKLKKNSAIGHNFENCTIIGQSGSEIIADPAGTGLSYFFFRNCNISNLQSLKAQNRGSFTFDPNTTIKNIGEIKMKNKSWSASFGAAFTNAPINIENGGGFIDFGLSEFIGRDAPYTYCIKAAQGGILIGLNDDGQSTYSKGSDANIICDNCNPSSFVIGAKFTNGSGIRLSNSSGFMVDNCEFSSCSSAVKSSNSSNLVFTNSKSIAPYCTWDFDTHMGTNETLTNNQFISWAGIDLYLSVGINISNNPMLESIHSRFDENIKIIKNEIRGNINLEDDSNIDVIKNSMHHMNESYSLVTNYKCNNFNWGMDVSDFTLIDLTENNFNGAGGLTFECSFNDQVDKGNKFLGGAEVTGTLDYQDGAFLVSKLPNEFPAHSPDKIMEDTGNSSFTCTQGIPIGFDSNVKFCNDKQLAYIKSLILKLLKCRSDENASKGECHKNMRIVNKLLKLCPNLKNDANLIEAINQGIPQAIYQQPNIHDVMNSLNENTNMTPILEIKEKLKNHTMENIYDDEILSDILNENENIFIANKEIRNSLINNLIQEYDAVQSEETSINNYKNALLWYLEYNRDQIVSQTRKTEIKNLAEDCEEFNSPGQKLAVALCIHLAIEFNEGPCLERRSTKTVEVNAPHIYPNPVSNTLYIHDAKGDYVEILSVEGTLLFKEKTINSNQIDVANLKNGIYFLKVGNENKMSIYKFIKIE